jgi:E3 ubiquitin-protein ligase HECTD2
MLEFVGEEGIDAGGLKKEWFLMVAREVFDPNHGKLSFLAGSHHRCLKNIQDYLFTTRIPVIVISIPIPSNHQKNFTWLGSY